MCVHLMHFLRYLTKYTTIRSIYTTGTHAHINMLFARPIGLEPCDQRRESWLG